MKRLFCGLLILTAWASPVSADWTTRVVAGRIMATGTASKGTWRVTINCSRAYPALTVSFILRPHHGYHGSKPVVIKVDNVSFPVAVDGAGEFGIDVHDYPNDGMPRSFLDRLMAGRNLVMDGAATAKVPAAIRTFPLAGSAPALRAVLADCPRLK